MDEIKKEIRLSVSKVKTFDACKKQFEFSYIFKLPKKDHEYHTYGKLCHAVLEYYYNEYINGSRLPNNVVMAKSFNQAIKEYKEKLTPELKQECWNLCNDFLKNLSEDKKNKISAPTPLACEKKFEILLAPNLILLGCIDRIEIDCYNTLHVIDYKTTKNKKYLKEDWFQLLTYCWVMIQEHPELEKIKASYMLLRHDFEMITKEFSKKEIMEVRNKYIDYANKIQNEKIYEPNPNILCNYCDFLNLCEAGKQKVSPKLTYGEVDW